MKMSESIVKLSIALAQFRGKIKQPKKDSSNPHFNSTFVNLEGVVQAFDEVAPQLGLSFIQVPITEIATDLTSYINKDKYGKESSVNTFADRVGIYTILLHESGEFIQTDPIFALPVKNDPQGVGSTITYLKRYSLSAVLGITSDEDDDGNNGTGLQQKQTYSAPPKQTYQAPPKQDTSSPEGITVAQIGAMKTKLSIVAKKEEKDAKAVFEECKEFCNIADSKSTKELTKQEAVKIISYLGTLEKA